MEDFKFCVVLFSFIVTANCTQFGNQSFIDQQLQFQDHERYGLDYTDPSHNSVYPQLTNFTDATHGIGQWSNGSFNDPIYHRNSSSPIHPRGYNNTERFLNKTISNMAKGVCMKEVPTASLLQKNEILVAGNGSDPTLSRIQVCCEGYQRNIHNFRKCDPICKNECVNGFCAAPDTCVCFPGHVINFGGFCLATCPIGCGNGICRENTCICKEGYILEPNGKFCYPRCSSGCLNGNCTAPEVCTCIKGFSFSAESRKCEPVCSKGCKNGECVAPEVCNCDKGYSAVKGVCQPTCSKGCLNGVCVAPEKCQCPGHGWSLDSTSSQCVASCDKNCLNGVCSGPNQCTCRAGYTQDPLDAFRCNPKCEPPCENGICSGPNMCLCYQGYRKVKGTQKCAKI